MDLVELEEREKREKYQDLTRKRKKLYKVIVIPIVMGALDTVNKELIRGTRGLGNKRTSEDYPNYSIIKIGQNTEKGLES